MAPASVFHHGCNNAAFPLGFRSWVFISRILEVRPPEVFGGFFIKTHVKERQDLVFWVFHVCGAFPPGVAPFLVEVLKVGDHQGVFGSEERVKAGFGDIGFPQDTVNADDANSFGGEQLRGAG